MFRATFITPELVVFLLEEVQIFFVIIVLYAFVLRKLRLLELAWSIHVLVGEVVEHSELVFELFVFIRYRLPVEI